MKVTPFNAHLIDHDAERLARGERVKDGDTIRWPQFQAIDYTGAISGLGTFRATDPHVMNDKGRSFHIRAMIDGNGKVVKP